MRRDLRVLELLVTRRAETLGWIHEQHFAGLSRKSALNRLGDLTAAGYLQRATVAVPGAPGPESAYTLGPRGKAALELRSLAGEHFRHRRFNPTLRDSSIPHQIIVNRVADWLGADLTPEHLLPMKTKEQWRHKPDGIYPAQGAEVGGMVWLGRGAPVARDPLQSSGRPARALAAYRTHWPIDDDHLPQRAGRRA